MQSQLIEKTPINHAKNDTFLSLWNAAFNGDIEIIKPTRPI
jgi:hypothetical protein